MVQLELDEASEATLEKQALERGMKPAELATEIVKSKLQRHPYPPTPELIELRKKAIQQMLNDSKGRTLGLKEMGLTMREFMHLDHKY
jgi:hypothetical protein